MKNVVYQLMSLGCLSLGLVGAVQANIDEPFCPTAYCSDVVFSPEPVAFRNVACGAAARSFTYTLKNNQPNSITLYDVKVIPHPGVPLDTSGVTIVPAASGCLTTVTNGIGNGVIPGNFATCTLTLTITPAACPGGQPVETPIARQLNIGVQSQQAGLLLNLNSAVSVVGSGEDFAVLGGTVANNALGAVQIIGDLGSTAAATGQFDIYDGVARTGADVFMAAAISDFSSAYTTLLARLTAAGGGCEPYVGNIAPGTVFYPGYYCLQQNPANNLASIVVGTQNAVDPIVLVGDGTGKANFYFFVDSRNVGATPTGATCGTAGNARCNLDISADTSFAYENGASPENVFWIMGNNTVVPVVNAGQVYLRSNSEFDGTILMGSTNLPATAITTSPSNPGGGTSPTLVRGSLWASAASLPNTGNIQLYGNTVSAPAAIGFLESLDDESIMQ